ncbi:recombinase family protein [Paenarthrobacter sp. PH39-S1]|uniref:recombinase family protein n=1 Tax=Paenarthrobacter sp. PH39-S1 TaxID=3046204 RepID=UPI0024BB48BE|nr:recombinase family protein [Paenarthrobacter sp. PH39-S1]MDJ0356805.1 recombinase family protein [Paenarthrobacter sp. PH39-S1]
MKEVLTIADSLHDQGVGLRILTGTLTGTYNPTGEGKLFFVMMAAFAELERDMIHQRTVAGLAAARAPGRTGGRPTVMDTNILSAARARPPSRATGTESLAPATVPPQVGPLIGVPPHWSSRGRVERS